MTSTPKSKIYGRGGAAVAKVNMDFCKPGQKMDGVEALATTFDQVTDGKMRSLVPAPNFTSNKGRQATGFAAAFDEDAVAVPQLFNSESWLFRKRYIAEIEEVDGSNKVNGHSFSDASFRDGGDKTSFVHFNSRMRTSASMTEASKLCLEDHYDAFSGEFTSPLPANLGTDSSLGVYFAPSRRKGVRADRYYLVIDHTASDLAQEMHAALVGVQQEGKPNLFAGPLEQGDGPDAGRDRSEDPVTMGMLASSSVVQAAERQMDIRVGAVAKRVCDELGVKLDADLFEETYDDGTRVEYVTFPSVTAFNTVDRTEKDAIVVYNSACNARRQKNGIIVGTDPATGYLVLHGRADNEAEFGCGFGVREALSLMPSGTGRLRVAEPRDFADAVLSGYADPAKGESADDSVANEMVQSGALSWQVGEAEVQQLASKKTKFPYNARLVPGTYGRPGEGFFEALSALGYRDADRHTDLQPVAVVLGHDSENYVNRHLGMLARNGGSAGR